MWEIIQWASASAAGPLTFRKASVVDSRARQAPRIGSTNWNSVVVISWKIEHAMWNQVGNYIKKLSNILRNPSKIEPQMQQNSWKIDLWSSLGALWVLSWRQDGPRVAPRTRIDEKSSILGWPVGSKMEPKSIRNQMKNWLDFWNDFESTFSRYWVDFGSKNLSKMRGLRSTSSTLLRICEKCDLERPSHRFAIFFDFESIDFRP